MRVAGEERRMAAGFGRRGHSLTGATGAPDDSAGFNQRTAPIARGTTRAGGRGCPVGDGIGRDDDGGAAKVGICAAAAATAARTSDAWRFGKNDGRNEGEYDGELETQRGDAAAIVSRVSAAAAVQGADAVRDELAVERTYSNATGREETGGGQRRQ